MRALHFTLLALCACTLVLNVAVEAQTCDVTLGPGDITNLMPDLQAEIDNWAPAGAFVLCLEAGYYGELNGHVGVAGDGLRLKTQQGGDVTLKGAGSSGGTQTNIRGRVGGVYGDTFVNAQPGDNGKVMDLYIYDLDGSGSSNPGGFAYVAAGGALTVENVWAQYMEASEGGGFAYVLGTLTVIDSQLDEMWSNSNQNGVVIRCMGSATCTLMNTGFWHSDSVNGGAISAEAGTTLVVDGCTFDENRAWTHGGAIAVTSALSATITNCVFTDNYATNRGGSIVLIDGAGTQTAPYLVADCTGSGSYCLNDDGGFINVDNSEAIIRDTTVSPGYASYGAAVSSRDNADVTLRRLTVNGGSASIDGGAVDARTGTLIIEQCTFIGSTAATHGGCVAVEDDTTVSVSGTLFSGCSAGDDGGGMFMAEFGTVQATIVGCVFDSCTSNDFGGGLAFRNGVTLSLTDTVFIHNTAADRGAGIDCAGASTAPSFTYSDVWVIGNSVPSGPEVECRENCPTSSDMCFYDSGVTAVDTCDDVSSTEYTWMPIPADPVCDVSPCADGSDTCAANELCVTDTYGYSCMPQSTTDTMLTSSDDGGKGFLGGKSNVAEFVGDDSRLTLGSFVSVFAILALLIVVVVIVVVVNTCVLRESGSSQVVWASISLFDFVTDVLFVWSISAAPELFYHCIAAGGILLVAVIANVVVYIYAVRPELSEPEARAWMRDHPAVFAWVSFLSFTNLGVFQLLGCGLFGVGMFSAPWSDAMKDKARWIGLVSNVFEDLPQLGLQVAVIVGVDASKGGFTKTFAIVSLIFTVVVLINSLVTRCVLLVVYTASGDDYTSHRSNSDEDMIGLSPTKTPPAKTKTKPPASTTKPRGATSPSPATTTHNALFDPSAQLAPGATPATTRDGGEVKGVMLPPNKPRAASTNDTTARLLRDYSPDNANNKNKKGVRNAESVANPVTVPDGVVFCEAPAQLVSVSGSGVVYTETPVGDDGIPATQRSAPGGGNSPYSAYGAGGRNPSQADLPTVAGNANAGRAQPGMRASNLPTVALQGPVVGFDRRETHKRVSRDGPAESVHFHSVIAPSSVASDVSDGGKSWNTAPLPSVAEKPKLNR